MNQFITVDFNKMHERMRSAGKWTCKAEAWDSIVTGRVRDIHYLLGISLTKLQVFSDLLAYGKPMSEVEPCDDFVGEFAPDQIFVLSGDKGIFVVDTQGFNYARYTCRVL